MKTILVAAATMLSLSAGTALAALPPQYNVVGNPFPFSARATFPSTMSTADVVAEPPANVTGSQAYQNSGPGYAVAVVDGRVLPINGSNGIVQTANSLPRGFEHGTPTYTQAQSVQRYLAKQEGAGQDYARTPGNPVVEGQVLPPDGGNGILQTANSLPSGFERGMVPYMQNKSVVRYAQSEVAQH
jgi:hypothetical protein